MQKVNFEKKYDPKSNLDHKVLKISYTLLKKPTTKKSFNLQAISFGNGDRAEIMS